MIFNGKQIKDCTNSIRKVAQWPIPITALIHSQHPIVFFYKSNFTSTLPQLKFLLRHIKKSDDPHYIHAIHALLLAEHCCETRSHQKKDCKSIKRTIFNTYWICWVQWPPVSHCVYVGFCLSMCTRTSIFFVDHQWVITVISWLAVWSVFTFDEPFRNRWYKRQCELWVCCVIA